MTATGVRGQPLAALGLVLTLWVGARVLIWEEPVRPPHMAQDPLVMVAEKANAPQPTSDRLPAAPTLLQDPSQPGPVRIEAAGPAPLVRSPVLAPLTGSAPPPPLASPPAPEPLVPTGLNGGHQMLWLAAVSQLPVPESVARLVSGRTPTPPLGTAPAATRPRRWSGDGWFLWRDGGNGFNLPGSGLPGASVPVGTYGASQYGAVLRYRVMPQSGHRPTLYLRGTGSIERPRYEEAALGLSVRPLARIPVAATAELRATRSFGETRLRPAAALVTELPPLPLPLGLRGEAYLQAGYVGGRGATAFIDGQARLDREVVRIGPAELRAGGGAWGGAQEGARRLDVGPSASLGFSTGGAAARLSADWRFRVAGRAAPSSGPAITLSAGF